jgi:hypothetical protein
MKEGMDLQEADSAMSRPSLLRRAGTRTIPDPPPCTGEESQTLSLRDHSMQSRIAAPAPDPPPCTANERLGFV